MFCALARSKQLRRPGRWQAHTPQVGRCVLSPHRSQLLGFLHAQWECCLKCVMCLLWGADLWLPPSWQMSTIQDPRKTWLATGSLLAVWYRLPSLGLRLPLFVSGCCLPASASSRGWASLQLASFPLVFAQSSVLSEGPAVP